MSEARQQLDTVTQEKATADTEIGDLKLQLSGIV